MLKKEPSASTAPSRQPVFSPVMADGEGRPTIFLVQRLGQDQIAIGALSTDYMVKLQEAIAFGRRGHAAIVDQEGNTLAHPSAELQREMKNIARSTRSREWRQAKVGCRSSIHRS